MCASATTMNKRKQEGDDDDDDGDYDDDDDDGDGDLLPLALLQKPVFPRQQCQSVEPILPVLNLIS